MYFDNDLSTWLLYDLVAHNDLIAIADFFRLVDLLFAPPVLDKSSDNTLDNNLGYDACAVFLHCLTHTSTFIVAAVLFMFHNFFLAVEQLLDPPDNALNELLLHHSAVF
jgi:hypothetical protein